MPREKDILIKIKINEEREKERRILKRVNGKNLITIISSTSSSYI